MYSTQVARHIDAPPSVVYRALLDADAVAKWRVPQGMSSQVHEFDAREGGAFRVSLTYDTTDGVGKSSSRTDTYHGHFRTLVPDEQVVEVLEFETSDPAMRGTMTMTTTLTEADGGQTCSWCTRASPTRSRPQTTRRAPGWRWTIWLQCWRVQSNARQIAPRGGAIQARS